MLTPVPGGPAQSRPSGFSRFVDAQDAEAGGGGGKGGFGNGNVQLSGRDGGDAGNNGYTFSANGNGHSKGDSLSHR